MADQAVSEQDVVGGGADPEGEVDHEEPDGVGSEFDAVVSLEAATRFVEADLEGGEEPGHDHSEDGEEPADGLDPPAEPSVLAGEDENPLGQLDNRDQDMGDVAGQVGGGGPAIVVVLEVAPHPDKRNSCSTSSILEFV